MGVSHQEEEEREVDGGGDSDEILQNQCQPSIWTLRTISSSANGRKGSSSEKEVERGRCRGREEEDGGFLTRRRRGREFGGPSELIDASSGEEKEERTGE